MYGPEIAEVSIIKITSCAKETVYDLVAVEKELHLLVNGKLIYTFYTSPKELKELITGFCVSEGIVNPYEQGLEISLKEENGIFKAVLHLKKGAPLLKRNEEKSINLSLSRTKIFEFSKILSSKSPLFQKTGCFHVAGLFVDRHLLFVSEDISRYNAIDKVLGKAILNRTSLKSSFLVLSCRVFKKIISKAVQVGIPVVISRGAPTFDSIKLAQEKGITLIGFLRENRFNIYTHEWRVKDE